MSARPIPLAIAIALMLGGCSSGGEGVGSLPDDAVVTYEFHDSSVPPQYHRSVTLTVTREQSRLVIDSYGDVLADESAATAPGVWTALGDSLATVTALEPVAPDGGCVGGTGIELRVSSGDDVLVDLSPEFCGGSNDSLEAPIRSWIAPARDQFPATDVLAPEGE